VHEQTKSMQY